MRARIALSALACLGAAACANTGLSPQQRSTLGGAAIGAGAGAVLADEDDRAEGALIGGAIGAAAGAIAGAQQGQPQATDPRRQYYDQRTGRYYYYDNNTGRYYYENGQPYP